MIVALCIVLAAAAAGLFLYWQDNGLVVTKYSYNNQKIPKPFDGFTIVQLSDLHNKRFGRGQARLIETIRDAAPDLIVITGDLIDCHRADIDTAMELVNSAVKIAPVAYAPGNHECKSGLYGKLSPMLERAGVNVLNNRAMQITRAETGICVMGIKDIEFLKKDKKSKPIKDFRKLLADVCQQKDEFTILLAHRPEYFEEYAACGVNLVFSGHAHGGQVRLPGIGGLFAPGQGWNPKYTNGVHKTGQTTLVISRGLGNSEFPFRVFNRPEIVVVTLHTEKIK